MVGKVFYKTQILLRFQCCFYKLSQLPKQKNLIKKENLNLPLSYPPTSMNQGSQIPFRSSPSSEVRDTWEKGWGWDGEETAASRPRVMRTLALSSQSVVGPGPGSGPAMKSPSRIFFAFRLGCFPCLCTSCQGNQLLEDSALFLSWRREFLSSFRGSQGPHVDMAEVISGSPQLGV